MKNILIGYFCITGMMAMQAETIFFDLSGVLLSIDRKKAFESIGIRSGLQYYTQFKRPQNPKKYLFDCLSKIKKPQKNAPRAFGEGLPLPQLMIDWLASSYNGEQKVFTNAGLLQRVHTSIDSNDDMTAADKQFIKGLARYMFTPEIFAQTAQIIPEGLNILRACHNKRNPDGTRSNKLYVISNWDAESFACLRRRPDMLQFWAMFDGFIISGQENSIKPAQGIFNAARTKAAIEEGGIFIDDQLENIEVANALGFDGVLCDHENVWVRLEALNIVEPRTFVQKNHKRINGALKLAIAAGALYYAGPLLAQTAIGQWIVQTRIAQVMSNFMGTLANLSRIIS